MQLLMPASSLSRHVFNKKICTIEIIMCHVLHGGCFSKQLDQNYPSAISRFNVHSTQRRWKRQWSCCATAALTTSGRLPSNCIVDASIRLQAKANAKRKRVIQIIITIILFCSLCPSEPLYWLVGWLVGRSTGWLVDWLVDVPMWALKCRCHQSTNVNLAFHPIHPTTSHSHHH
ncbi:hypothetical protein T01_6936 [Trichinella spiralis]|uniref:Uncharacterized protein n=1 Tax=Trichinella spiralis TaxID=6334 RepID=A0A0V1B5X1_TRISP|nr:hypothetical protein T01_6936 [Trichinella spiralis]